MTLDGFFNIKTASELGIELCKKNLVQRDTLYTRRKQHLITCHFLVLRRTRVISIHPEWCLLNRGLILSLRYTLCWCLLYFLGFLLLFSSVLQVTAVLFLYCCIHVRYYFPSLTFGHQVASNHLSIPVLTNFQRSSYMKSCVNMLRGSYYQHCIVKFTIALSLGFSLKIM